MIQIIHNTFTSDINPSVYLIRPDTPLDKIPITEVEKDQIRLELSNQKKSFSFFRSDGFLRVELIDEDACYADLEKIRQRGDKSALSAKKHKSTTIYLNGTDCTPSACIAYLEGMALGAYDFSNYKSEPEVNLNQITAFHPELTSQQISRLNHITQACYHTRDMVNEPPNILTAKEMAERMQKQGSIAGLQVTVFDRGDIARLGMAGLEAVNRGSAADPTFTVLEWKPDGHVNPQPLVLAGKGLVYDTGGINLKSGNGLNTMKSDMAGAAAVFGTMWALAKNNIPAYVVGLIPATDNRPAYDAMVPGDILKMANGKTVEIVNTDAEGRLVLADALIYAARFNPLLVIDIATLTGNVTASFGRFAIAAMQQKAARYIKALTDSSLRVHERIVEMPFWEEYDDEIKSDIADIRNLGKGRGAGTILAGKFLAHFADYPWIHLDIAATAFAENRESYRGTGATAAGVRLMYDFIERMAAGNISG